MDVPADAPAVCPVCDREYECVSRHEDGVMVNLIPNERYRRVCLDPDPTSEVRTVRFFHHTHEQAAAE
jgi:hypothetical protein